jgi:hypothetical protein
VTTEPFLMAESGVPATRPNMAGTATS